MNLWQEGNQYQYYSNQLHQKKKLDIFETINEASKGLGFSEHGIGKAYHAGRNQIGEYKLYTLDTTLKKSKRYSI